MTEGVECASVNDTLTDAARKMRDLDVGALPICGDDNRLKGMITDRDITVRCVAEGRDPNTVKVSELADGEVVTIGADDSLEEALRTMTDHDVRRVSRRRETQQADSVAWRGLAEPPGHLSTRHDACGML